MLYWINKFVFQLQPLFVFYIFSFVLGVMRQVSYLAVLFLILHSCNMYTILQVLKKKGKSGLKLRYRLRAIAYRLSNEIAVLVCLDCLHKLHRTWSLKQLVPKTWIITQGRINYFFFKDTRYTEIFDKSISAFTSQCGHNKSSLWAVSFSCPL